MKRKTNTGNIGAKSNGSLTLTFARATLSVQECAVFLEEKQSLSYDQPNLVF